MRDLPPSGGEPRDVGRPDRRGRPARPGLHDRARCWNVGRLRSPTRVRIGRAVPTDPSRTERHGQRSGIATPLRPLRRGEAVGDDRGGASDVRPFKEKEIALLERFADQAVIAIENARLFQELQERNAELNEALEQQTATGEILRVIASSPTDVQHVLQAIVASAARICDADISDIRQIDRRI